MSRKKRGSGPGKGRGQGREGLPELGVPVEALPLMLFSFPTKGQVQMFEFSISNP